MQHCLEPVWIFFSMHLTIPTPPLRVWERREDPANRQCHEDHRGDPLPLVRRVLGISASLRVKKEYPNRFLGVSGILAGCVP